MAIHYRASARVARLKDIRVCLNSKCTCSSVMAFKEATHPSASNTSLYHARIHRRCFTHYPDKTTR